jgi:hypothetical protein
VPFLTHLRVEKLDDGRWMTTAPLVYESARYANLFTVPAEFVTDMASVPRLPLAYLLAGDTAHAPAVLHDYLYQTQPVGQEAADGLFLEAMADDGVPWWRRRGMWLAVRVGGGWAWADHAARRAALNPVWTAAGWWPEV